MKEAALLRRLAEQGLTQAELAERLSTTPQSISRWMLGQREPSGPAKQLIRELAADLLGKADGERAEENVIPIMGYIGTGAEIEPDSEQVPPEGLDQVALPFAVPEDEEMIGFQVRGDSMLPKYNDGDVVVVSREQRRSTDSLIGEDAAVRIYDESGSGRRLLKHIMPGPRRHTFNLESLNARTLVGVRVAWASEIWAIVPAGRLRTIAKPQRRTPPGRRLEAGRQR